MTLPRALPLALVLLMALLPASPARAGAQAMSTLEGVVRDADGTAVAHVLVSAVDSLTNERRRGETNDRGFFRLLDLAPGWYVVSTRVMGRVAATQRVYLLAGERRQVEFALVAAPTRLETVTVEERRDAPVAIERTSVSTALRAEDIERLPLDSRNVMDLARVAPGMRSFHPVSGYSLPGAGSLRDERGINLYVDGVEMKNLNSTNVVGSPQSGTLIPVDALEEYHVLLNPYDAELTRGVAYVVSAVTRRGTNETHGSAFGYFENRDLLSVNGFQRGIANFEKPDFDRRQVGASVRGPVVRDRLFYAATVERSQSNNYVAVIPGQPASDPAYWDRYAGVFDAPNRNDAGLLRLTFAASERHQLDAMVASRRLTGASRFGGTDARESAVSQHYGIDVAQLRHRWLPTPGLAHELSVQYVGWTSENHPLVPGPELRYPTLTIRHGDAVFEIHERQLRAVERLTYGIGSGPRSHLLKGGVELARVTADQFAPTNEEGVFRFPTETGRPDQATIAVGSTDPRSTRDALATLAGWVGGAYVNDEWHPASRLVVNLGLRYDAELHTMNNDFTVPWVQDTALASRPELANLLNRGDRRDDLNNISPRLSFSWDVTGHGRAFVRGGLGIMYDRIPGFVPFNERQSATWRRYTFTNPDTLDAAVLRERVIAGGVKAAPPAITLLPRRMDVPENRQWSLGFGAQLSGSTSVNVDYVDQRVRHLFAPINLNWLDASQSPAKRVLSSSYANISAWGDFARARYRALLMSIDFRRDTTAHLTLAYTLASAKADWDVETSLVPDRYASGYYTMQRTSGDERHRVVLSGGWTLPYGLTLAPIVTLASPRPYRAIVGQDLNKDNLLDDDWIGDRRYAVPSSAWRNWYRVVDVRLTKAIVVRHGTRLSLVAEAFNLFNSENYSGYFGTQRSAAGEPRPDFGSPSGVFAPRQLQLGSRLQF